MDLIALLIKNVNNKDYDLQERVKELVIHRGWNTILDEAYSVLTQRQYKELWYDAVCVFYYSSDEFSSSIAVNEIVARLYWCLEQYDNLGYEDGFNLVWSTTILLKGISYNSDWEPLADEDVLVIMRSFQAL